MNVLVTGASGFLGLAVVNALVAHGHRVLALVRPTARLDDVSWAASSVEVIRGDLRQQTDWTSKLDAADAVVHLAAATSGDLPTQVAGTVLATENLLRALPMGKIQRFVHVSSLSVYDFDAPAGSTIDESCRVEPLGSRRDPYTETKLWQEKLVRDACTRAGTELVVVRPGAIFGGGKDWNRGAAFHLGRLAVIVAPRSPMRLTYAPNCADAIALAVTSPDAAGATVNIVDDDPPTHRQYFDLWNSAPSTRSCAVSVPYPAVALLGRVAGLFDRALFDGRARLPELLAPRRQRARWRPLQYPNDHAKRVLGWKPRVSVAEAIDEIQRRERRER